MNHLAFLPKKSTLDGLLMGLSSSTSARPASSAYALDGPPRSSSIDELLTHPPLPKVQSRSAPALSSEEPQEHDELAARLAVAATLEERFVAFARWAEAFTGSVAVFVTDSEGLPMVRSTAAEDYLAVAAEISTALENLTRLLPVIEGASTLLQLRHSPTDEVRWVDLVACSTAVGHFTVGLLSTEQLTTGWSSKIRAGLQLALSQPEG